MCCEDTGKAVVPFGFGLSYSTFQYDLDSAPSGLVSLDAVRDMVAQTKADGRTFPDSHMLRAATPLIKYSVNVTNTGSVDADEVVLGFLKPPGAGVNGVPLQTLCKHACHSCFNLSARFCADTRVWHRHR